MDTIEEIEYKGYTIKIHYDEDCQDSPRDWDNLGTMMCIHNRYSLGDEHNYRNPVDFLTNLISELPEKEIKKILLTISGLSDTDKEEIREEPIDFLEDAFVNCREDFEFCLSALEKYYIFLPLYLYDHSGITMNTTGFSCRWDSGQVGLIYVSNKNIKKEYSRKIMTKKLRERVHNLLKSEVEIYDSYIKGEVYGYEIEKEEEHVESCWGFVGNYDYVVSEAKSIIDHMCKEEK